MPVCLLAGTPKSPWTSTRRTRSLPKAKIVVVAAAGQSGEDFQAAMQYIINNKIGYQVSDSWEEDLDLLAGPAENDSYETILTLAAAKGISFQFSTGDSGDSGLGTPVGAAGVPSNAPHGTAVGGTTLLNFGSGFPDARMGRCRCRSRFRRPLRSATCLRSARRSWRWREPVFPQAVLAEGFAGQGKADA